MKLEKTSTSKDLEDHASVVPELRRSILPLRVAVVDLRPGGLEECLVDVHLPEAGYADVEKGIGNVTGPGSRRGADPAGLAVGHGKVPGRLHGKPVERLRVTELVGEDGVALLPGQGRGVGASQSADAARVLLGDDVPAPVAHGLGGLQESDGPLGEAGAAGPLLVGLGDDGKVGGLLDRHVPLERPSSGVEGVALILVLHLHPLARAAHGRRPAALVVQREFVPVHPLGDDLLEE